MDEQETGTEVQANGNPPPVPIPDLRNSATDETQVGPVLAGTPNTTRPLLKDKSAPASARRAETRVAQQVARERIAALVAALGDTSNPLHQSAVDELVAIGQPAVPALNEALSPTRPWLVAYRAAEALGQIGDGHAAGPLLEALRHPNSNVRWSAVRALAVVGDARALLELRRVARDDRGKTSWGESVAGAARSALNEMQSRNMLLRGADLIKTAVACVLMLVALIVAWKIIGDLRTQLKQVGFEPVDPSVLAVPTPTAPPDTSALTPASSGTNSTPEPTAVPATITGSVRAAANVRAFPQVSNGEVIGRISQGDEIIFLAVTADGQWYRIRLGERYASSSKIDSANGEGWVNRSLLSQPEGTVPVDTEPADLSGGAAATPTP